MTASHRPTYVTLVAALRAEFNDMQLQALSIQMQQHRYERSSISVLAQAVHDAYDLTYDISDIARTAGSAWAAKHGGDAA